MPVEQKRLHLAIGHDVNYMHVSTWYKYAGRSVRLDLSYLHRKTLTHLGIVMAAQVSVSQQRQRLRGKRAPGKGLLDWIKLCRSFKQQTVNQNQIISFEELQKHNTEDDCWTAFRGEYKADLL